MGSHIKAKTQSYPKQTRSTLFELNQSKLSLTQTTPHFTSPQPCPATTPTTPKVTRTRTNNHTTRTTVLPTLKTNTAPATPTTTPTLNLLPAYVDKVFCLTECREGSERASCGDLKIVRYHCCDFV